MVEVRIKQYSLGRRQPIFLSGSVYNNIQFKANRPYQHLNACNSTYYLITFTVKHWLVNEAYNQGCIYGCRNPISGTALPWTGIYCLKLVYTTLNCLILSWRPTWVSNSGFCWHCVYSLCQMYGIFCDSNEKLISNSAILVEEFPRIHPKFNLKGSNWQVTTYRWFSLKINIAILCCLWCSYLWKLYQRYVTLYSYWFSP